MNPLMIPTVAGNLMAGVADRSNKSRVLFRHFADNEECGFDLGGRQLFENPASRMCEPFAVMSFQFGADAYAMGRFDAIVFFDVEAEHN
jgi:hypothetical protein